jgi:hypothetical protein
MLEWHSNLCPKRGTFGSLVEKGILLMEIIIPYLDFTEFDEIRIDNVCVSEYM